jgi:MFS family permease
MSQAADLTGHRRRTMTATTLLMAVGATMVAAPVYVLLGEKGIDVSPSLWTTALAFCRAVTGLFGLLAIVSTVTGRGSRPKRDDAFRSVVAGVLFIAAAVAGLGLVIVITGLAGLVLLFASGAGVVGAFRSGRPESVPAGPEGLGSFTRIAQPRDAGYDRHRAGGFGN